MIRNLIILVTTGAALIAVAGCNTVRGAGEDLESAANEVDRQT